MKKLLMNFSLFFLIMSSVGLLPVSAQEDSTLNDGSSATFKSAPKAGSDDTSDADTATPDLFTGTMRYSIPVLVPAGRKGMEPKLALTYRSTQPNGWLGMGWELEVGSIERSTKNGVDYDGNSYVLRMNGADMSLVNVNGEYRAKIESAFLRIKAYKDAWGRPIYWEITDKMGTHYFFGQTPESRQDDPGDPIRNISPDPNKVFKWCLDYVVDANGNFMQFFYFKDPDHGQIYLDHIDYTGNGTITPRNTVTFVRDTGARQDAPVTYKTNFGVKTVYRLERIHVTADGKPVRSYALSYTTSAVTSQSLLSTVQQVGKDGSSTLPASHMDYSPENIGFGDATPWLSLPNYTTFTTYVPSDFNGDGQADVLFLVDSSSTFDARCYPFELIETGYQEVAKSLGSSFGTPSRWGNMGMGSYLTGLYRFADFNGDGKTDVLYFKELTCPFRLDGNLYVSTSTGSGFNTPGTWLTIGSLVNNTNTSYANRVRIADVDDDGKADVLYVAPGGALQVALSTGSNFSALQTWGALGNGDITRYKFADFDGNGKMDVLYTGSDGCLQSVHSNGTGFTAPSPCVTMGNGAPAQYNVGDFNGDGKADIVYIGTDGSLQIALSTGSSLIVEPVWLTNVSTDNTRYKFADIDGNGKTDALFIGSDGGLQVALSTGSGFTAMTKWGTLGTGSQYYYFLNDFSGDGRTDAIFFLWCKACSTLTLQVVTANGPADNPEQANNLLTKISNGIGGSTGIAYKSSMHYTNTFLPFPVQTVSSVKADDGNGNVSETQYDYEGGYYYIGETGEREFRGFNHVTVTRNATGATGERTVTETWFHQGNDTAVDANAPQVPNGYSKGKPYRIRVKDGPGNVYSETTISYQADENTADGSFNPPDTAITYICDGSTTICNGSTSGQSKMTKYTYDAYGNVTSEQVYNSASATAPYRTTTRTFTTDNDPEKYLFGYPKTEVVTEGTGTVVASTSYYYDDPSDCQSTSRSKSQSPTQGNLTTIVRWLDRKPAGQTTDPEVNMSYELGNLVCIRDARNNATTFSYDSTKIYSTATTNPMGQTITTQYYGVDGVSTDTDGNGLYGQIKSVTDSNGAFTKTVYDNAGRTTKVIDSYSASLPNGTVSYSYPDDAVFGSVGQQHITMTTTVDYTSGAVIWSKTYFDGFGRTIKTLSQGPENKVIRTDTTYNVRGLVSSASLPYFDGSQTVPVKTFNYDPMGRVTKTTNPDGTFMLACYLNGVTAGVDSDKRKRQETRDVFGRLVQVDEYDSPVTSCTTDRGTPYATITYQYDVKDNLIVSTDAENNATKMSYDTLGRKYYMKDPDMGEWAYEYDPNGNLVSQLDARQRAKGAAPIRFQYDALNRIRIKDYPDGMDITYTYDEPGYTNFIGRLTTMTDASGTTHYHYDKLGRTTMATKAVDNNPATTYSITMSYNALGKPAGITYPAPDSETVSYFYDAGYLTKVSGAGVNYATYAGYNALGQPGTITYGNGIATTYQYNQFNNRLTSIVTGNADEKLINLTYVYTSGGNITSITDRVNPALTQSFWYDGLGRLEHAQTPNGPSYGDVYDLFYSYTKSGNISNKELVAYDYTPTTCAPGKPHAVKATSDNRTYCYDENGNMTSESQGGVAYRTIAYDYDNMPQTVTVNTGTTTFVYDGTGSRVKKTGPFGESIYIGKLYECRLDVCTKYIFAENTRIAMKTGDNVLYYHGDHLGSTQVVTQTGAIQDNLCSNAPVRINGASPRYFTTLQAAYDAASDGDVIQARAVNFGSTDAPVNLNFNKEITVTISGGYDCGYTTQFENSELVGMITDSAGTVTIGNFEIVIIGYGKHMVDMVRYRPFGETLLDIGILSVNHKYTSQEFDIETGLYNYNARFYNPVLGRFISADTIVSDPANPQALNRYSYVLNNPHRYIDPSGHYYDAYIDFYSSFYDWGYSYSWPTYDSYNYFNYYDQISSQPSSDNYYVPSGNTYSNTSANNYSGNSTSFGNYLDNLALQNVLTNIYQSISLPETGLFGGLRDHLVNESSGDDGSGGGDDGTPGPSHGLIVTVTYWPSTWGSFSMVWDNSLLPSFYRSGTIGRNGKIALPFIGKYQYGQHPMTPAPGEDPYPALNVYMFSGSRNIPAFNLKTFKFDTIHGLNVHEGNSINSLRCGGLGCHVLPEETWDSFMGNFPPGSSGLYLNLWLFRL